MSKKHILFLIIGKILSGSSSKEEEERVDKILYDSFISEDWNEDELGSEQHMQNRIADRVNEAVCNGKILVDRKENSETEVPIENIKKLQSH